MREKERINTIIKEINYWKEHKLLPTVYCDYLLTLYTKGEGVVEKSHNQKAEKSMLIHTLNIVVLIFLLPFAFVIIYSTLLPTVIKIVSLFLFIIITLIIHKHLKIKKHFSNHLSQIVLLLLFLIVTVFIGTLFFNSQLISQFILLLNFVSWLVLSRKNNRKYLLIASLLGILFIVIYMIL